MATSAGQPAVTNQVSNQAMTNPNVTTTIHSMVITCTNQSASGSPICHQWVWFILEGCSGCSLGPAQMEYWSIILIIHQELGEMSLQKQWPNYCDVLIEFDSEVDVEWVAQKLLRMEQWPLEGWWRALAIQRRGMGSPKGGTQVDRSIKLGSISLHGMCRVDPSW